MSTKTSLGYYRKEYTVVETIHIYHEMLDEKYYLESNNTKTELSKELAEVLGKALNEYQKSIELGESKE